MSKTELQQTASNAGIIGLTSFAGALVGFVLQLLVAFHFGAGTNTDAFFMAQSTSEMLSKLLLGGAITGVFLPIFVERLTRGQRQDAWDLALNLIHITSAIFIIAIVALALFTRPFVGFIAPGFDAETSNLTINLLRVLLPSFLFLFLVELTTSMLHSLKQFALPAMMRMVSPLTSIVAIILLVQTLGIYSLAIGVVIGSIIQIGLLSYGLYRKGMRYKFVFRPLDPLIKRLVYLVYPFALAILVTTGAGIVYRILVSDLPAGSLASLKFAEKITQIITIMFLTSVSMVTFPILSEKASQLDFTGMRDTLSLAIRLITFVSLPIIVGIALLRNQIIGIVYQRGSFSPEDAAMTSIALLFLVIGLTTNGIGSILSHATLALQETRASVAVTIASQFIAIALFVLLVPKLAHAGLALGSSLVPLSIGLLHFLFLTRFIPNLTQIFWHATYVKTFVLTTLMALIVILVTPRTANLVANSQVALVIQLAITVGLSAAAYFLAAHFWKVPEMHELTSIVSRKAAKWRS